MHRLLKRFEDLMVAVTFAESAEYDEAHRIATGRDEQHTMEEESLLTGKEHVLLERARK